MNAKIGFAALYSLFLIQVSAQTLEPLLLLPGPGEEAFTSLQTGPDGSLYASGSYNQTFEWGGYVLPDFGNDDVFLTRLDSGGQPLWVLPGGSADADFAAALAPGADGGACWGGFFWEEIQAGSWTEVAPGGGKALFVLAVSPDGVPQWGKVLYGAGAKGLNDLATDADGNLYAIGYFGGALQVEDTLLTAHGDLDGFVAKWDAAGAFQWAVRFGESGSVRGECLAVRHSAQLYLGGRFLGNMSLGGTAIQTNTPDEDGFVAALSAETGEPLWLRKAGAQYDDAVKGLAVNSANELFATGTFVGVLQVAEGWTIQTAGFNTNVFLIRYHAIDGTPEWAQSIGNLTDEQGLSLSIRNEGPVVAGLFRNSFTIEDRTITGMGEGFNGFAAGFRPEGSLRWLTAFPGNALVIPEETAVDENGYVWVAGGYSGEAWFNGNAESASGGFDGWLGRLQNSVTAINEPPDLSAAWKVFPNPTGDFLFLEKAPSSLRYTLFRSDGMRLQEGWYQRGIDLRGLPEGIYFLHARDPETGDEAIFTVRKTK